MVKIPFFSKKSAISVEYSEAQNQLKQAIRKLVKGWKNKFIEDIYNESILYPHEEMEKSRKIKDYNAFVGAAIDTLTDFLVGGEVKVVIEGTEFEQQKADEFVNRTKLFENVDILFSDLIAFGNHYEERIFMNGEIVYYDLIPNPEYVYHIYGNKGIIKKFFIKVPDDVSIGGEFKTIKYYGDKRKSIKGYEIDKDKVFYVKMGISSIPSYGRGALPRVINDYMVLVEIERALAVISRYKAIPKKLISLIDGSPIDIEHFSQQLSQLGDWENPIINRDVKVEDLSYSGHDFNFQPIIDYLKRKLTVALAPEYIIHGEDVNRATSKEQKEAFLLRVKAIRSKIKKYYINEIAKWTGIDKNKIDIEFGTFDIGQNDEKRAYVLNAWNSGIITLNEARKELGLDEEKSEIGDMYSFELKNASQEPNNNLEEENSQ